MITYQTEGFKDCLPELKDLFEDHYQEIGNDPENIKLNPDYDTYFELERLGKVHLVTVRYNNKIVGYNLSLLAPLLHFKHILNAHNDAIYVDKEYRKGTVGYRLIKFTMVSLKNLGVDCITIHTKTKQPFDRLCEKLGMTLVERNYIKYLGD